MYCTKTDRQMLKSCSSQVYSQIESSFSAPFYSSLLLMKTEVGIFCILFSQDTFGYSPANVHIIGHSLGAHVAGEAGKRHPGIGRITGKSVA